jgi:hypothetical protein
LQLTRKEIANLDARKILCIPGNCAYTSIIESDQKVTAAMVAELQDNEGA